MSIRFSLAMGALSDPIEVQLQRQGLTLGSADYAKRVERWATAISSLRIHGLLTEAESGRARKRLLQEIQGKILPLPAGKGE